MSAPSIKAAASAPISNFAAFVKGDVKGGEAAHAFRRTMVQTAFEQAFKGNYSPLTEALALCDGKAKKARAYLSGFIAAGVHADPLQSTVKKVPYAGALTLPANAAAREEIISRTASAVSAFFTAFDAVIAEPPKVKAPKAEAPAPEAAAPAALEAAVTAAPEAEAVIEVPALVDTVCTAIASGMLSAEELTLLRAALATLDAAAVINNAAAAEAIPA